MLSNFINLNNTQKMRDGGKSEDIQHTHHSQMIKQLENIHRHESNCKYDIAIFFVRYGRDFFSWWTVISFLPRVDVQKWIREWRKRWKMKWIKKIIYYMGWREMWEFIMMNNFTTKNFLPTQLSSRHFVNWLEAAVLGGWWMTEYVN